VAMPLLQAMDAAPARRTQPPFHHVLAFADPSGCAAMAVSHAALLAAESGARLTIFHASDFRYREYHAPGNTLIGDVQSAAERLARATLESLARTTTGVPADRRRVVIERAPAAAATLADVARRLEADVVVMVPHRGRFAPLLGRSLTRATIERLHDRIAVFCARGEARPYRRIVVPTDFTLRSRAALRLAARMGAHFGAEVTVLHAIGSADDEAGARAALSRYIPRELALLTPRPAVERGEPWAAIVNAAERMEADLVVMSTSGHDSLSDTVQGSHAERVIRHAPCPVLVC
jgi:nucleotide-binding universal stress UspA family protein